MERVLDRNEVSPEAWGMRGDPKASGLTAALDRHTGGVLNIEAAFPLSKTLRRGHPPASGVAEGDGIRIFDR